MKKLITLLTLIIFIKAGYAQCESNIAGYKMATGMFLFCGPADDTAKIYVAKITSVDGNNFSCRFLHSNSVYQFADFKKASVTTKTMMQAAVVSNKGGGFGPGTIFTTNVFMPDPHACDLTRLAAGQHMVVIATFVADGKNYLAQLYKNGDGFALQFMHSKSRYTVDKNFKVLTVTGGAYSAGSQLKVVHARRLEF